MLTLLCGLTLAIAAPKPTPDPVVDTSWRAEAPAALATRPFTLPQSHTGQLSNGVQVVVVENHEVPRVYVRVVFDRGAWTDPEDMPGLASATMDMLNEGARGLTAAEISTALRRLATGLGSSAGRDGASVSVSALTKNLDPSVDLLAAVLLEPDFPNADWELMRKKRLVDLAQARNNPREIIGRVWRRVMYDGTYQGALTNEESYGRIKRRHMRRWYRRNLIPEHAIVLVGGDTTRDTALPILEKYLGGWKNGRVGPDHPEPTAQTSATHSIYLVDKPGAPQSVIRAGLMIGERTGADHTPVVLGNMPIAGMFTSRVNLNLREDKGYTYGARASVRCSFLPCIWQFQSSVKTDTTAASIRELMGELDRASGEKPVTDDELNHGRGYLLGTWPLRFENPQYLLEQTEEIWRYGLPTDWSSGYPERVQGVDLATAQAAWKRRIEPGKLSILIVGDAETIRPGLVEFGLPIVDLDVDGNPPSAPPEDGS